MYTIQRMSRGLGRLEKPEKEVIHSGHFMVSDFEADEQDDEENVAVPIPETNDNKSIVALVPVRSLDMQNDEENKKKQQQLAIDTSLSKLFQCMSLAYKQKLTSPKWNRFRGIRLRWKDKIRLNNVIWRCWHLQFIKKERTLVCQFASPMDADTHNKPEAVVLEGKYWKRKLEAVTAEYKRWRLFYRNKILGHTPRELPDPLHEMNMMLGLDPCSADNMMMIDEDYMDLMSDTLFSTIANQPYLFPDSREIAKAGWADFIQPSLGPLQPNLDEIMDIEGPLQELITSRLPPVPEENQTQVNTTTVSWGYIENAISSQNESLQVNQIVASTPNHQYQLIPIQQDIKPLRVPDTRQHAQHIVQSQFNDMMFSSSVNQYLQQQQQQHQSAQGGSAIVSQPPSYTTVISKSNPKPTIKNLITSRGKHQTANVVYTSNKSMNNIYNAYSSPQQQSQQNLSGQSIERILQNTSQVPTSIQPSPVPDLQQQYKIVQQASQQQQRQENRQGYKFQVPNTPNIKFTSHQQKDLKSEPKRRGAPRGRRRSSSNTREPPKKPPLISAISDPSLLTSQNSALLTQLLTNNKSEAATLYMQNRTLSQEAISNQSITIKKEDLNSVAILPQSTAALLIPAQVSISTQPPTPESLLLNSFSNSNSPITDPLAQSIHSPTSSQDSIGSPCAESPSHHNKDRRVGHIHAEQKRRCNIKNGFDMMHSLIPHLNQNPNAKLSKAALLQKGAEYITQLRGERNQLKDEIESLKQQIQMLKTSISNCQSMLPATGAPVSRRSDSKMQEMFEEYVRNRTMENWKFWMFSLIFRPLLNSFNNFVSTSTLDDLYTSTMHWVEQHCTLVDLRPVLQNSLTYLCKKTDILTNAERLPDEAREIVLGSHSQSSSSNQSNSI